jgi:ATP-dependent Clp protease ATP-binding subunit ClpA
MYESVLSEAIAEERQRKRNTFDSEVWERNSSDDLSSGEWTSDSRAAPSPMDAEAVALLGRAAAAAAERGHAKTTPGDLLLALFEEDPGGTSQAARESPALRFLRQRGIDAGEMRRASDWSDNASDILRLASQRAASREKRLVGTEDLLWAMFQPTQSRSRSLAVER